jgi:hypothetical protein
MDISSSEIGSSVILTPPGMGEGRSLSNLYYRLLLDCDIRLVVTVIDRSKFFSCGGVKMMDGSNACKSIID